MNTEARLPTQSERVRTTTPRWAARLIVCALLSVAVHTAPILAARKLGRFADVRLDYRTRYVEIGLEAARTGAPALPSVQRPVLPQPASPAGQQASPPATETRREHRSPRAASARREIDDDALTLRPAPTRLDPPGILARRNPPRLLSPDTARARESAPESPQPPLSPLVPSMRSGAADLAAMVPRGALVTLLVRTDRVRSNPNASSVRRLLAAIPEWDQMLGETDLDPLRDLDEVLLASARPVTAEGAAPDWFVLARAAHRDDSTLRRAIERMESAQRTPRAPSPISPPDARTAARSSATSRATAPADPADPVPHDADAAVATIWARHAAGSEVATFAQAGTRRSFVLLGDGLAAVAAPGQVDRLMAAYSRRGEGLVPNTDPRIVMLLEAEGVRNFLEVPTRRGPFPMPTRAAVVMHQALGDDGAPTGAAQIVTVCQYDNDAQALAANEMLEYSRGRWRAMIAERAGERGGLGRLFSNALAGLIGVDLDALESVIDAMRNEVQGPRVVVRVDLTDRQVRAVLALAALGR